MLGGGRESQRPESRFHGPRTLFCFPHLIYFRTLFCFQATLGFWLRSVRLIIPLSKCNLSFVSRIVLFSASYFAFRTLFPSAPHFHFGVPSPAGGGPTWEYSRALFCFPLLIFPHLVLIPSHPRFAGPAAAGQFPAPYFFPHLIFPHTLFSRAACSLH